MSEKFCLKWNNFQTHVSKSFGIFRNEEYLHDVTLVSDDHNKVPAHRLVLSACSAYFRDIFKNNNHAHPLLCLDLISSEDLKNVMDYIYNGEVQIYQENLDKFLAVAQRLKLEGLIGDNNTMEELDNQYVPKEEFVQSIINEEQFVVETEETLKSVNKAPKKKQENCVGTVAVEDNIFINEQIYQYLEGCSDGGYKCKLCGKTMAKRDHLLNHIETHMEGVSYNCSICQKSFRSRNSLSKHKSVYHK